MLSRPMSLAFEDELISLDVSVFDYGCGRGGDLRQLRSLGVDASGWDPAHDPTAPVKAADVVNLGYVINVIEDRAERSEALCKAWSLARSALVVAARPSWEAREVRGRPHGDGVVTAKNTFQKFYEQDELRKYIEATLGERALAAAPGIFYVFRDEKAAQAMLAHRARRGAASRAQRIADLLYELHRGSLGVLESFVEAERRIPGAGEIDRDVESSLVEEFGSLRGAFYLVRRATGRSRWADIEASRPSQSERRFNENRELLEALMDFVDERGRLPHSGELPAGGEVESVFGSIRAAFALVRRVTDSDRWVRAEGEARRNFLVYLALAAFGGRPKFSDLPEDLQFDVRDLFGNYKRATEQADELLFAAGNLGALNLAARSSEVGKLTPEAIYVHVSAIPQLPPLLRVYEGCGQALSGTVEEATIVKLHREKPQISYLAYPNFDRDPHPALSTVIVCRLGSLNLSYRDFRESDNPPILHRKETFVDRAYPGRDKFARLTLQEEKSELLSSTTIGTLRGWSEVLGGRNMEVRGHRLQRRSQS